MPQAFRMDSSTTTVTAAATTTAAAPHAALPSGASARAHEAAAAAPYRIPIHLLPPGSTKSVAPDFLVCLLDQLHTPEQRAARLAAHTASAAAAASSSAPGDATASVASLSAERPTHDRLPVLLAISSHNVAAVAAAAAADEPAVGCSAAVAAAASIGGVCHVTLLQAADEEAWHAARERSEQSVHPNVRNVVRTVAVPLAHASRCPCRAPPPPPQIDTSPADAAESTSAAAAASAAESATATATAAAAECAAATSAAAASAAPASAQQLRLAVVVVPTLHSLSHCHRCAPHLPPARPLPRVLVTRRPGSMRAFPGCWVFPGGACDPTDKSLAHTGARELTEETGLRLAASAAHSHDGDDSEHAGMRVVSAWEAVFPVLRPSGLGPGQKFLPKGRYLIVMFAAEVAAEARDQTAAGAEVGAGAGGDAAGVAPCVRCEVPLRLCPTEVDAAAWMSGAEFDAVRARAAYFHTDDEAALQKQQQPQLDPSAHAASQQQQQSPPQRCLAETDECGCAELPAMVTRAYFEQHAAHTTLLDRPCAVVGAPPAPDAAPDAFPTTAVAAAATAPADPFLPARMRCCALFGLYPNRAGSGMAEGHLVALEEMCALGIF